MPVRTSVELSLDPAAAFENFMDDLSLALAREGLQFEPGPQGRVTEGSFQVGKVIAWKPGEKVELEWHPANWQPEQTIKVEIRFEAVPGGTRITLEHANLENLIGDSGGELAGWFASGVAAPFLRAVAPGDFGDWLTDRRARRPSGSQSRQTYRDPIFHRPNFMAILKALALRPDDYLVEIGCGGGAFLEDALKSGCKAAAIDHSADMVRLASQANRESIQAGRLEIRQGDAGALPFKDETFSCAVMTGVFGFIDEPVRALSEIARVLAPGGRFALFTASQELRGTPAAPEPMASRLYFYEDDELEQMARQAGFSQVRVERPDTEPYAREAGVPLEALGLFGTRYGQLLLARR